MTRHLTTGGAHDPFLPELLGAIRQANAIDLAVAFVRSSGLALLYSALAAQALAVFRRRRHFIGEASVNRKTQARLSFSRSNAQAQDNREILTLAGRTELRQMSSLDASTPSHWGRGTTRAREPVRGLRIATDV